MSDVATVVDQQAVRLSCCPLVLTLWEKTCADMGLALPHPLLPQSQRVSREDSLLTAIDCVLERTIAQICKARSTETVQPYEDYLTIKWCPGGEVVGWWAKPTQSTKLDIRAIVFDSALATFEGQSKVALEHLRDGILALVLRGQLCLDPLVRARANIGPIATFFYLPDDAES